MFIRTFVCTYDLQFLLCPASGMHLLVHRTNSAQSFFEGDASTTLSVHCWSVTEAGASDTRAPELTSQCPPVILRSSDTAHSLLEAWVSERVGAWNLSTAGVEAAPQSCITCPLRQPSRHLTAVHVCERTRCQSVGEVAHLWVHVVDFVDRLLDVSILYRLPDPHAIRGGSQIHPRRCSALSFEHAGRIDVPLRNAVECEMVKMTTCR